MLSKWSKTWNVLQRALQFVTLEDEVIRPHVIINPGNDAVELVPTRGSMFCEPDRMLPRIAKICGMLFWIPKNPSLVGFWH